MRIDLGLVRLHVVSFAKAGYIGVCVERDRKLTGGGIHVRRRAFRLPHPLWPFINWKWHQDPRHRCHSPACRYCT